MSLQAMFEALDAGKAGAFRGFPHIEWRGARDYAFYQLQPAQFAFIRPNREVITPEAMMTDGGSIPRIFWNLAGLSPWDYFPAYVIHDWLYLCHWMGKPVCTFDEANLILAEALVVLGCPHVRVMAIYDAVARFGRPHWDPPADVA